MIQLLQFIDNSELGSISVLTPVHIPQLPFTVIPVPVINLDLFDRINSIYEKNSDLNISTFFNKLENDR